MMKCALVTLWAFVVRWVVTDWIAEWIHSSLSPLASVGVWTTFASTFFIFGWPRESLSVLLRALYASMSPIQYPISLSSLAVVRKLYGLSEWWVRSLRSLVDMMMDHSFLIPGAAQFIVTPGGLTMTLSMLVVTTVGSASHSLRKPLNSSDIAEVSSSAVVVPGLLPSLVGGAVVVVVWSGVRVPKSIGKGDPCGAGKTLLGVRQLSWGEGGGLALLLAGFLLGIAGGGSDFFFLVAL